MEKHIRCIKCKRPNGHPSCIQEVRRNVNNYVCDNCDLPPGIYLAECIFGHRARGVKRYFYVKWRGYKKSTLEPERKLQHCISLVNEYCRMVGIPISAYPELAGTSKTTTTSLTNWTTTSRVIETARKLLNKHNLSIPVTEYIQGQELENNTICVLNTQSHSFVFYKEDNQIRLSDGGNLYLNCPRIRRIIKQKLKAKILPIESECQTQEHFCGSAAVLIIQEIAKIIHSNKPWSKLVPTKTVKKIVEKSLHKVKQKEALPDRNTSAWLYCSNCNKPYHRGKRKSYNAHIRHCLKRGWDYYHPPPETNFRSNLT